MALHVEWIRHNHLPESAIDSGRRPRLTSSEWKQSDIGSLWFAPSCIRPSASCVAYRTDGVLASAIRCDTCWLFLLLRPTAQKLKVAA
jgi:hypothetical protein